MSTEWVFPLLLDPDLREGGGCFDPVLHSAVFVSALILVICYYPLHSAPARFFFLISTLPAPGDGAGLLQGLEKGQMQQSTQIKYILSEYNFQFCMAEQKS